MITTTKRTSIAITDDVANMIKDLKDNGVNISYEFRLLIKTLHKKIINNAKV
jgi:hypothetical protein